MIARRAAAVLATYTLAACSMLGDPVDGHNELVMKPGDTIVARTPSGTLRAEALSEQKRHYVWRDVDRTLTLGARWKPWYGAVGAYAPANPFSDTNAGESSYNFASFRDLKYYLAAMSPSAYSSNGLLVAFGHAPNGSNSIDIERLCVDHRPPVGLAAQPGSSITWTHIHPQPEVHAWFGCARTTYDPVATEEREFRDNQDISRQVDFWGAAGGMCTVPGGATGNRTPSPPAAVKLALEPGDTLSFENANGTLSVSAPTLATRVLRWHNRRRSNLGWLAYDTSPRTMTVDLAANDSQPGAAGAIACNLISGESAYVIDFNEGVLNFASLSDFRSWLRWGDHGPLYLDDGYSRDGMLAGFHVGQHSGNGPLLAVDVVRVCIHGSQPRRLPDATNKRIHVDAPGHRRVSAWTCPAGFFDVAGTYGELRRNDRLDTAQERRIRAYRGI